jgi:hypothetical protein
VKLATVLSSPRAVAVSLAVVRTFVRLREFMATHADLAKKIEQLEARYDGHFRPCSMRCAGLMNPPEPEAAEPRPRIGFEAPAKPKARGRK